MDMNSALMNQSIQKRIYTLIMLLLNNAKQDRFGAKTVGNWAEIVGFSCSDFTQI